MGERICALAARDDRFDSVVPMTRRSTSANEATPAPAAALACDVIIDFSSAEGTREATAIAVESGAALLVGTTGLIAGNRRQLDDAARCVPVMIAANTAFGVVVLHHLVREASRLLSGRFEVSLSETHHVAKRDAPSGTALRLAESIRDAGGPAIPPEGITAIREGDVVGDHRIAFERPEERLEIRHSALSRDVFARGALDAAAWLAGRPPGLYTIEEAIGVR